MLSMISLFNELNAQEIDELGKIVTEVSFPRGATIFTQNEMSRDFFIIKHGQVEISVKDMLQEKRVLAILRNGEFFGEMSLFDKQAPRPTTAQAFQNTTLFKIPGRNFESLLEDQPSICFKLLGTMAKRLRDAINPHRPMTVPNAGKDCRVITIGAARSGYGKTVLATTLTYLLSHELPRRVLFLDLDLSFGDGTFLLGVYTPRSIVDFAGALGSEPPSEDELNKFVYRLPNNLSVLSAPRDLRDAERVGGEDIVKVISACRKHYDYIVIDTNSGISEVFLNALDMSDHVIFLVASSDSIAIKSNNSFFRAMTQLNLPESQINLVMSFRNRGAKADHFQKQFNWRITGELPEIPNFMVDSGHMPYQTELAGEFCNATRLIIKSVLHEEGLQITSDSGFLSRWFYTPSSQASLSPFCAVEINTSSGLAIDEEACTSLLKAIRSDVFKGFLDNALRDCLHLTGLNPGSAAILQLLGEIFFLKRDFAQALEVLSKTLEIEPENYLALAYCSVIKNDEGMKKQATAILEEILKKNPGYPDLLNDMGKLHHVFHQIEEAVGCFEKSVEANPRYTEARLNLAVALGDLHRYDDALRQLFLIKPKNIRTYYLIGNFLYSTGKFYGANAAYSRVSEIDPKYLDIQERLGSLNEYFAKIQNLLELHKKLSRVSPTYPDLHYKIGNFYLLLGNRQGALEEFQWADALRPGYRDVKTKIEDLAVEPEFDTMKFLDADGIPNHELEYAPDAWVIEFGNLTDLYLHDENHMYVLRMTNSRTGKKTLFPIFPSLAKSSHPEFEAGSVNEVQDGDNLEMEIFDNRGIVASSQIRIEGMLQPGQHIPVPIRLHSRVSADVKTLPRAGEKPPEKEMEKALGGS